MNDRFREHVARQLQDIRDAGLYKSERVITSMQSAEIEVAGGATVLNFCANNYLGLADNEEMVSRFFNEPHRVGPFALAHHPEPVSSAQQTLGHASGRRGHAVDLGRPRLGDHRHPQCVFRPRARAKRFAIFSWVAHAPHADGQSRAPPGGPPDFRQ